MYILKKIDTNVIKTPEEYNAACSDLTSGEPCRTVKEAQEKCGHVLRRQRCGYSGSSGRYDYVLLKVSA